MADLQKQPTLQKVEAAGAQPARLAGWRLGLLTLALCLAIFLPALDTTIVSTALVPIANDLGSFEQSSWVVSGYLVPYFSFLIIWAKLSDIFGRKAMLLLGILVFIAFSGACGGAATLTQLIVFRALQGIGAAGIFSMVPVVVAEMVPPQSYATYNGIINIAVAMSYLAGPLLGGAIPDHTTWRWIFYINLPVGVASLGLVLLAMPASFPDVRASNSLFLFPRSSTGFLKKLDFPGFLLLLIVCVLLIVAIEEAGISYAWNSALVLTLIVLSFVFFCCFLAWQWYLASKTTARQAVIPWSFFKNRVLMGIYLNSLCSGVLLVTVIIEMPEKFQSVEFTSALDAGVRILPYTLMVAFGSAITRSLTVKGRVPPIFVLAFATALQILGMGLLYSTSRDLSTPNKVYGFEILAGFGVGLTLVTLLNVARFCVERKYLAVAVGGVTQFRILGGALGVSIATNLLNGPIESLAGLLPTETIDKLLQSISAARLLSPSDQALYQAAYLDGYQKQFALVLGFAVAEVLALALMWEWPPRRLP